MEKTFRPWHPEQAWLFPPSVLDLVPEGHPAHFIRELVRESLDLSEVHCVYSEARGFPPYHPTMMTALLLYAYTQGVYSSRKIAKACEERVDFLAVTAQNRPDFRTVSEFRRRHLKALSRLFVQVLQLCREAGLVRLGHVALDGTKVKANASKHKAMSYGRMKTTEPRLKAEVQSWLTRAEQTDQAEDREHGADRRGDELPEWVANKQKRLEKLREARAALEAEARAKAPSSSEPPKGDPPQGGTRATPVLPPERAQRNFTDPESRIMKANGTFEQAYNAQLAVDAQAQIIVAQHVSNEADDQRQLVPLVQAIRSNTGRQAQEISADGGYATEANLKELNRRHIRGYVALGRQRHDEPASLNGRTPRSGTRLAAMWARLRRGGWRTRYRLRKQVVEPVVGQIKGARGFRQFLLRGLEKVTGEWALVCTAHNLLKLLAARPA